MSATVQAWWEEGVIYQIYPRSFQDSGGDGIGDLAGIERRLDYLVALGVDAIWLSPIYPSPMADFGYDVSDYCAIDPRFGTLEQLDRLLASAHLRGLKVILVPNHTSDKQPCPRKPRLPPEPEARLVPLARPGSGRGATEQLGQRLRCLSWEWDAPTGQYYLHAF